jgi:hypothetical protein
VLALVVASTSIGAGNVEGSRPIGRRLPPDVEGALKCFFMKPTRVLNELNLLGTSVVAVRFTRGSLPGWPQDPESKRLNVVIYGRSGTSAVLLLAEAEDDHKMTVVDNAYTLSKGPRGWDAGEGNGGLWTYSAIGKYAATLDRSAAFEIVPGRIKSTVNCDWMR